MQFKQRAAERFSDYGVTLGRAVANSPPFPPPVLTPATDNDKKPVATVEWRDSLSPAEEQSLQQELIYFRSKLCDEDRDAFDATRRLTPARRAQLLQTLTPSQRTSRGLRFADEPSPFQDTAAHMELRRHPSVPTPQHPRPRVQVILMDLWCVADPLQLDLAIDAMARGINVAYNGPYSTRVARNMTRNPAEVSAMRDAVDKEVAAGRMCGYFPSPPFPVYRVIPLGTVPKKNTEELRPVDNYSVFKRYGINALSDDVAVPSRRLDHAVEAMLDAGPNVHFVKWDIDKAYQVNAVRSQDQWLTVADVPERGFSYRLFCPFGLKASGFRFEVTGRIINTLYAVFQHRISVDCNSGSVITHPPLRYFRSADQPDPLWTSPPDGHAAFSADADHFLHPVGAQRLREHAEVTQRARAASLRDGRPLVEPELSDAERFVDDFLHCCSTLSKARAVAIGVLYVHARSAIRLKQSKFEHVSRATDFRGYDFIAPHTLSLPADKRAKALEVLRTIDHDHVSFASLEITVGVFIFLMGVFPQLRGLLSPLYRVIHHDPATRARGERQPTRKLFAMTSEARKCVRLLRAVVTRGPASSTAHLRNAEKLATHPQAVFHTDWGFAADKKRQAWGIYNITHNSFVQCEVPPHFARWCRIGKRANSSPALEAFAWVVLLKAYGSELRNCAITVFSDNMPAIQAYHRCYYGHLTDSIPLAAALRQLAFLLIRFNVLMCLEYVPTTHNLSDPVSRFELQTFAARLGCLGLCTKPCQRPAPSMPTPAW